MPAFSRRQSIRTLGLHIEMFVDAHGTDGYRVAARLTGFQVGRHFLSEYFSKHAAKEAGGVMAKARGLVDRAIDEALAQSDKPSTYLRVENLPQYSEDKVDETGLDIVASWTDLEGDTPTPVRVYKVYDESRLDAFVQVVHGKRFYEASSSRANVAATASLFAGVGLVEALEGGSHTVSDPATRFTYIKMIALRDQTDRQAKADDALVEALVAMSPERLERVLSRVRSARQG